MLNENLKNLRQSKGLSQEELAAKLNVVRQTVSKWEKGLSVPDSEMLMHIAEELDTTVGTLLGETVTPEQTTELQAIAEKLEILNSQFSRRNESRRKAWRIVAAALAVNAVVLFIAGFNALLHLQGNIDTLVSYPVQEGVSIIGGADGPTSIFVTRQPAPRPFFLAAAAAAITACIGIYKTKRN